MAYLQGGGSGAIAGVGEEISSPLHVTTKPPTALGHYALIAESGLIGAGAGANSEILQFRWTDVTNKALIYEVCLNFVNSVTGFTAGFGDVNLTVARGWTGAGTGGSLLTLSGTDTGKMRTGMASSAAGIRIATTAALGAGTKTFDGQALGRIRFAVPVTANALLQGPAPLFLANLGVSHPLSLFANEGFSVRATLPATGTWNISVGIKWAEVLTF